MITSTFEDTESKNNSSNNTRSYTKGVGLDIDIARKNRESNFNNIRKDKRNDKTELQRRKFSEESLDKNFSKNHLKQHKLEMLSHFKDKLFSDSAIDQLNACIYLRKVLAVDRNPPIAQVVNSGVVPQLVNFLGRFDNPNLQLEAAWAITNIACGGSQATVALLDAGVVQPLITIMSTCTDKLREQALWAIGNISGDSNHSRNILINAGILPPLLWQLGLCTPPDNMRITSPSLSTMRYIAWTFSNLSRRTPALPVTYIRPIIFALAELLQSPDEELLSDVCLGFHAMLELNGDEYTQLVLEQGVLTRVIEILESSSASKYPAIRVLSALGRSETRLFRRVLLSSKYQVIKHYNIILGQAVSSTAIPTLPGTTTDRLYVYNNDTATDTKETAILKDKKEQKRKEVIRDILMTLIFLTEKEHQTFGDNLLKYDQGVILQTLTALFVQNSYESTVLSGNCLSLLAMSCSEDVLTSYALQFYNLLKPLLSSTELHLLLQVITALQRVCSLLLQTTPPLLLQDDDILERLAILQNIPSREIATHAQELETLLENGFSNAKDGIVI